MKSLCLCLCLCLARLWLKADAREQFLYPSFFYFLCLSPVEGESFFPVRAYPSIDLNLTAEVAAFRSSPHIQCKDEPSQVCLLTWSFMISFLQGLCLLTRFTEVIWNYSQFHKHVIFLPASVLLLPSSSTFGVLPHPHSVPLPPSI